MRRSEIALRIKSCERMSFAGKAVIACFLEQRQKAPGSLLTSAGFRVNDVRECHDNLEETYLIRMFAVFEAALRDHWCNFRGRRSHPNVEALIDRIAARRYVRFDDIQHAHDVRNYRNSLLHGGAARIITISQARRYLNMFLSYLPREWQRITPHSETGVS